MPRSRRLQRRSPNPNDDRDRGQRAGTESTVCLGRATDALPCLAQTPGKEWPLSPEMVSKLLSHRVGPLGSQAALGPANSSALQIISRRSMRQTRVVTRNPCGDKRSAHSSRLLAAWTLLDYFRESQPHAAQT